MNTKFNVGEKVAIVGEVSSIVIDGDGVIYNVEIESARCVRIEDYTSDQLFPASDIMLEEDDLK